MSDIISIGRFYNSIFKITVQIIGGGILLFPKPALGQIQSEQPNILVIMTDQQAWDAVGYAGNKVIKTPNLDRLASQGVNFSHALTTCPVSCPARTSILTGRLTEATTIRDNSDVNLNDCYYPTFDEILVKRGYVSEYHGKFHSFIRSVDLIFRSNHYSRGIRSQTSY